MPKLPELLVILGPTASGKTKLAVRLARLYNGEIVSADSRQVYKGMDLGTGKDLSEYGTGKDNVPYHLIDVADPKSGYDLKRYQQAAYKAIDGILRRGYLPILVGGSGLYLQAVVDGYTLTPAKPQTMARQAYKAMALAQLQTKIKNLDKDFFNRLNNSEQKNRRRLMRYLEILESNEAAHLNLQSPFRATLRYDCLVIGLAPSMETIRKNIKKRLASRFKEGMIQEVERLHAQGLSWEKLESFGLEYKYIALYLQKKLTKAEMEKKLHIAIGQFARRQMTWFKRWEKQGREIIWLQSGEKMDSISKI